MAGNIFKTFINSSIVSLGTVFLSLIVCILGGYLCHEAGENSFINLKFGSNVSSYGGKPINKKVLIKKNVKNAFQKFGSSFVPMGDSSCIFFDGIELILNSNRCQTFSTDLFSVMGINISDKKILIVKSTNHFYDSFHKHVSKIIYASVNGIYPNNPKKNNYLKLKRNIWPVVLDASLMIVMYLIGLIT